MEPHADESVPNLHPQVLRVLAPNLPLNRPVLPPIQSLFAPTNAPIQPPPKPTDAPSRTTTPMQQTEREASVASTIYYKWEPTPTPDPTQFNNHVAVQGLHHSIEREDKENGDNDVHKSIQPTTATEITYVPGDAQNDVQAPEANGLPQLEQLFVERQRRRVYGPILTDTEEIELFRICLKYKDNYKYASAADKKGMMYFWDLVAEDFKKFRCGKPYTGDSCKRRVTKHAQRRIQELREHRTGEEEKEDSWLMALEDWCKHVMEFEDTQKAAKLTAAENIAHVTAAENVRDNLMRSSSRKRPVDAPVATVDGGTVKNLTSAIPGYLPAPRPSLRISVIPSRNRQVSGASTPAASSSAPTTPSATSDNITNAPILVQDSTDPESPSAPVPLPKRARRSRKELGGSAPEDALMGRLVSVIEANMKDHKAARLDKRQAKAEVNLRLVKLEEAIVARHDDIRQLSNTISAQGARTDAQIAQVAMFIAKLVDAIGVQKTPTDHSS